MADAGITGSVALRAAEAIEAAERVAAATTFTMAEV